VSRAGCGRAAAAAGGAWSAFSTGRAWVGRRSRSASAVSGSTGSSAPGGWGWSSHVPLAELLGDALLFVASAGELLCVCERAAELVAGGGGLAQRVVALIFQAVGEGGQLVDSVLELAHEREA
jgi:hypothetical protein